MVRYRQLALYLTLLKEYLRPENQKTITLSGTIDKPVTNYLDKIQIEEGTVLTASIEAYWEVRSRLRNSLLTSFF